MLTKDYVNVFLHQLLNPDTKQTLVVNSDRVANAKGISKKVLTTSISTKTVVMTIKASLAYENHILTVSAASTSAGTVSIVLDSGTPVVVNIGASKTKTEVAALIAAATFTGWTKQAVGETVVFTSITSGAKTGDFTITPATTEATGTFSTVFLVAGVSVNVETSTDSQTADATAIKLALIANTVVNGYFTVTSSGATVTLTAKTVKIGEVFEFNYEDSTPTSGMIMDSSVVLYQTLQGADGIRLGSSLVGLNKLNTLSNCTTLQSVNESMNSSLPVFEVLDPQEVIPKTNTIEVSQSFSKIDGVSTATEVLESFLAFSLVPKTALADATTICPTHILSRQSYFFGYGKFKTKSLFETAVISGQGSSDLMAKFGYITDDKLYGKWDANNFSYQEQPFSDRPCAIIVNPDYTNTTTHTLDLASQSNISFNQNYKEMVRAVLADNEYPKLTIQNDVAITVATNNTILPTNYFSASDFRYQEIFNVKAMANQMFGLLASVQNASGDVIRDDNENEVDTQSIYYGDTVITKYDNKLQITRQIRNRTTSTVTLNSAIMYGIGFNFANSDGQTSPVGTVDAVLTPSKLAINTTDYSYTNYNFGLTIPLATLTFTGGKVLAPKQKCKLIFEIAIQ